MINRVSKYRHLLGYGILVLALVAAFAQISANQTALQHSIKSNIESRVTTVKQRCALTRLVQPKPGYAAALQQSLVGCLNQQAKVIKQAARTP